MRFSLLLAVAIGALAAQASMAVPVRFFGQDAPDPATETLDPNGAAATARADFLSYLDPATISTLTFEGIPAGTPPARDPNAPYASLGSVNFFAASGTEKVPAEILATSSAFQNAPFIGTYATSGTSFLYVVGYDQGGGITRGGVRIDYRPDLVTAGNTPKPFSSFGAYITDTEGYSTITLVLTPVGGGPEVILDYRGIENQGQTGLTPGNAQVSFIGFIDAETQYERIDIRFTDSSGIETDEAFGFDDFTVGEIGQFDGVQATASAADIVDEPGWRLLSAPVQGVSVDDLAKLNLVQGVAAGDGSTQQQYPDAGSNFYIGYGGGTRWDYIPAPTTGTELVPGRGFWWYWYDRDINPDDDVLGGGTSESVALDGFTLSAIGDEIVGNTSQPFDDNTNCASDQPVCLFPFTTPNGDPTLAGAPPGTVTPDDDDFYMLGNPYPDPYAASAISVDIGTLQSPMYIWNPGNQNATNPRTGRDLGQDGPGTYEIVYNAAPPPGGEVYVAPWNGMLAEVTLDDLDRGSTLTFTYDASGRTPGATPPFHGKSDAAGTGAAVRFELFGEMASGDYALDAAAVVRFLDDARLGWDAHDGLKPTSPATSKAQFAPVGARDGEAVEQAVLALPNDATAEVPLAFAATESGLFTLTWDASGVIGHLVDRTTSAYIPLEDGIYTFESEPTKWTERFALVLASVVDTETDAPDAVTVGAPSPNPASGAFEVEVRLAEPAAATVTVIDALGREVASRALAPEATRAGAIVRFETEGFAPGAYVVVVEAPGLRETRRVTVVR